MAKEKTLVRPGLGLVPIRYQEEVPFYGEIKGWISYKIGRARHPWVLGFFSKIVLEGSGQLNYSLPRLLCSHREEYGEVEACLDVFSQAIAALRGRSRN